MPAGNAPALARTRGGQASLIANPRAGSHQRGLSPLLTAAHAAGLSTGALDPRGLTLVHGGDGTLQTLLDDHFLAGAQGAPPQVAALGGGTMNVIPRWCGFSGDTARNLQRVVRAHAEGSLRYREVELLRVRQGDQVHHGFIFGMGPMIRVVEAFDRTGSKSKAAAAATLARTVGAVLLPSVFSGLREQVAPMEATIVQQGAFLPFRRYGVLFASATDQVFLGTRPFKQPAAPGQFNFAAYADSTRAISATFPLLARGWVPRARRERYVNQPSRRVIVQSAEPFFTLDGEIIPTNGRPVMIEAGPSVLLATNPRG